MKDMCVVTQRENTTKLFRKQITRILKLKKNLLTIPF